MPAPRLPHVVLDIHGVLVGRREPAGHLDAQAVLARLRAAGFAPRCLTNSSSVPPAGLSARLAALGIAVAPGEITTAATAVAHHLRTRAAPCRLYVIGSPGLREEIARSCGPAVAWADPEDADTLVVSRDPNLSDDLLARLARTRDLRLIATCRDLAFPSGTALEPGPGQTLARVERVLGRTALVAGKPNPEVLTAVMGIPAAELADTLVVGDSPEQDIALGRQAGARTVLIAPPPGSPPHPDGRAGGVAADHVIHALDELLELLEVAP